MIKSKKNKMYIEALVRKNSPTTLPYAGVASIKKDLILHSALIVEEFGIYYGILTANDLVNKPHNLVIDCLSHRLAVEAKTELSQAISIMKQENVEVLQVFENKKFIGIIHRSDILDHLSKRNYEITTKCEKANHREDINHFIHSIIHDLKSPVENISSLIDILQRDKENITDKKILDYVTASCNNAKIMISNLLEIAEVEGEKQNVALQITDINKLLKTHLDPLISIAKKKNIKIIKQFFKTPLLLETDSEKLIRVVDNVISNALKFTPGGGKIIISTSIVKNKVVIKISDTGIGIPLDLQKNIFEKFTKSKRTGLNGEKANGLGMHIAKQMAISMNGQIWIESDGKNGTAVFVELPFVQPTTSIQKVKSPVFLSGHN